MVAANIEAAESQFYGAAANMLVSSSDRNFGFQVNRPAAGTLLRADDFVEEIRLIIGQVDRMGVQLERATDRLAL